MYNFSLVLIGANKKECLLCPMYLDYVKLVLQCCLCAFWTINILDLEKMSVLLICQKNRNISVISFNDLH